MSIAAVTGVALLAAVGAAPGSAGAGPTLASRPTIAGSAAQGSRVTATPGTWRGSGAIRYAYRWYRCDTMGGHCKHLRGVKGAHHKVGANDVGHTLALDVRATDSTGATNGYTSLLGPIAGAPSPLVSNVQPVVSGSAVLGGTVHVDSGKWGGAPKSFAYQWIRCNANGRACAPISGEKSDTHTIVRRDVAHALVAIVQARTETDSRAVLSLSTAPVAGAAPTPGGHGPTSTAPPAVTGAAQAGKQLAGSVGTWSGSGTIEYGYQWYRCDPAGAHCSSIHGATKPSYTEVVKDIAHTIGFAVHAKDANGTTSAYASLIGPVAPAAATLVSTTQPALSGTPKQGQTLQTSSGSWSQTPTALTYQWQRCNANGRLCAPIEHAIATSYTLTAADAGHAVVAIVQATAGGIFQNAWSVATSAVAAVPGPAASAAPTVSGSAQAGKQLTGSAGTWSGAGTIQYGYQWYRCDAAGAHCSSIHGATKPTYTQVAKDVAHTLGFAVHATDTNGTSNAYASLIGPVAPAAGTLVSTAQPGLSGTPKSGQTLQATTGTWSQTPTAFAYQWQRCNANGRVCAAIDHATAATYTLTAADAGHALVAVVQATAAGHTQAALSLGVAIT